MKILLDENLDVRIKYLLAGHEVDHVHSNSWLGLSNGKLLKLAEERGYQAFVTADKGMPHQQNMKGRAMSLVVFDLYPNNFLNQIACLPRLQAILDTLDPGGCFIVEGPHPKRATEP